MPITVDPANKAKSLQHAQKLQRLAAWQFSRSVRQQLPPANPTYILHRDTRIECGSVVWVGTATRGKQAAADGIICGRCDQQKECQHAKAKKKTKTGTITT